jgi:hypothetical protein
MRRAAGQYHPIRWNYHNMNQYRLLALLVILALLAYSEATPTETPEVKIIIESVLDKTTGESIDNATLIIHVEREETEGLVYEDFDFSEYVIEGKAGVLKFPVEMEKEDKVLDS